jgi:hypothetical protein
MFLRVSEVFQSASTKALPSLAIVLSCVASAWSEPVQGSLPAKWNSGAEDCAAASEPPLQVHAYEPQTFILRQSLCASFEGNFLYLLVGSNKALLIDTGAIADPQKMPLAKTILELLPDKDGKKLPLLVAHTHRHSDHRASVRVSAIGRGRALRVGRGSSVLRFHKLAQRDCPSGFGWPNCGRNPDART